MKVFLPILCFLSFSSATWGDVSLLLCESDGMTPFDFRDINVGASLKCIVRSDDADYWNGGVLLTEANRDLGFLSDAEYLPAAGNNSVAYFWEDDFSSGFDLYAGPDPIAGDWFILTYTALAEGSPSLGLFDYDVSFRVPVQTITIHQIPEPVTNLLLGLGGMLSLYFRRPSKGLDIQVRGRKPPR